mmetsp:Transcript_32076/g.95548  ORF Transcript_32076/g.95548 Transcript_32076/m.95548 type:complete len:351 (-) Transcript_32076:110-1162(-)
MVRAGPKRLFAADEGCVLLRFGKVLWITTVHEVAKELPPCGRLETGDAFPLRHKVQCTGGRHGARTTLEALRKLRDALGVRHDHGQRVRGRDEELGAEDHVAVGVAVGGRAKHGRRLLRHDLVAALVQSHRRHELHGVRQIGVGVAMPRRVLATEVLHGRRVGGRALGRAKLLLDDALGIRPLHAAHGVVDHAEARHCEHLLDHVEVETLLQQGEVVLHAVKHMDRLAVPKLVDDRHIEAEVRHVLANLELLNLGGPVHHQVGHLLGCRAAILAIVLDAEIVVGAAGIVRGRADESAEGHEAPVPLADDCGGRRCREEAVRAAPDGADAVGEGHLDYDLDGLVVPVPAVT